MFKLCVISLFAAIAAPHPQTSRPTRLQVVDEGATDTGFNIFRGRLLDAIRRSDVKEVLSFTSADIVFTMDSTHRGLVKMRRMWKLDRAPQQFLRELESALRLGGRFTEPCSFVAPYVWTEFPESLSMPDYVVVVQDGAAMSSEPGGARPIAIATAGDLLRYDVQHGVWLSVTMPDGRAGYIRRTAVRHPTSYRVYFTKIMDEWKMVGFMRGID